MSIDAWAWTASTCLNAAALSYLTFTSSSLVANNSACSALILFCIDCILVVGSFDCMSVVG